MIIAITGIRDIHLDSHQIVESVIFAYVKAFPEAHSLQALELVIELQALAAVEDEMEKS